MVRKTPLCCLVEKEHIRLAPALDAATLFEQIDDMGRNCALLQPTGSF
jgi:hypothetical protein